MATHQKTAMLLTKRGTETLKRLEENYTDLGIGVIVRWYIGLGQSVIGIISEPVATISGRTYDEVVSSINAFIAGWNSSK